MTDGLGLDDIRAAREELDAVIAEIQAVPGYEDFLAVPTFADVAGVAADCPLVYLAAAEPGGLALVVRGTDVTHVPLDELTATALREKADAHLERYARYRASARAAYPQRSAEAAYPQWNAWLDEVTGWLWDAVMGPVLGHVGEATQLVVVAGGLLGLLPLHAAWTADDGRVTGRRYVMDTAPVSYAPNARALRAARRLAEQVKPTRLLAIANPWPVAAAPLAMAPYEALSAAASFPGAHTILQQGEATFLSFEWKAAEADVLHLACHGFAVLDRPLDSGLVLAGGQVTLEQMMAWPLQVRLAVLSACETAQPGTELPDEVVALPTGLLQAGVAGIVASQWSVPDRATAMLMTEFYRCWRWEQMAPAAALRAAQRWLRDTTTDEKRAHFATALSRHDGWLPSEVARKFLGALDFELDGLGHADIHHWGAFAHVGA
jgi:hypothetical protein